MDFANHALMILGIEESVHHLWLVTAIRLNTYTEIFFKLLFLIGGMSEVLHRVKREKHTSDPSALKWSKACFLKSPLIEPSSLYNHKLHILIIITSNYFKQKSIGILSITLQSDWLLALYSMIDSALSETTKSCSC